MQIKNEAMLITYSDSMGSNMKDLKGVLDKHFQGAISGVHLLPFFPSTGDRGFAPSDYTFMVGAVIGVIFYFALTDQTIGIIIILSSMVFKFAEAALRLFNQ